MTRAHSSLGRCARLVGSALNKSLLRIAAWSGLALSLATLGTSARAQVPADPFDYTRTTQFTYFGATDGAKNGLLKVVTVEPSNLESCTTTTYAYDDGFGNKTSTTLDNCAGAPIRSNFRIRTSLATYAAVPAQTVALDALGTGATTTTVAIPAGLFPTTITNALSRTETRQFDPRFGAVTQARDDPNALIVKRVVDDFGRPVQDVAADGTSTVTLYCVLAASGLDTSANSPNCASPAEAPANAVTYVQTEPHDASSATGSKMGAFARVYADRLGREVRSATESFDGATLIVKDTVYDQNGAKVLETQPYFLTTGSSTSTGANNVGAVKLSYDVLGRPTTVYKTDPAAASAQTFGASGGVAYGVYGYQKASSTNYTYAGLTTKVTNDKGQVRTEEKNAGGDIARITDASGAQIAYLRDAFSNLVQTKDALQNSITAKFDILGRKTQLNDPDKGAWGYCYDAIGQIKAQQNPTMRGSNTPGACPLNTGLTTAANQVTGWTTFGYDRLGRTTQRIEPEYTSTWSYDTYTDGSACNKGIGRLCETKTDNGLGRRFAFDNYGRPASSRVDVTSGPSIANAVGYDTTTGRVASVTYPTGVQVGYAYNARGYLQALNLATSTTVNPLPNAQGATAASATLTAGTASAVLWQAQTVSAWGAVEKDLLGNGVNDVTSYEAATGRIVAMSAGAGTGTLALNHQYAWDTLGNLASRVDNNGDGSGNAVSETFVYGDNADNTKNINRLTQYTISGPAIPGFARQVSLTYNALGMLLSKTDVGNYSYGASGAGAVRPHALLSVAGSVTASYVADGNGNVTSASSGKYRLLAYTSFDMPNSQGGISGPGGTPAYAWQYDENHQRIRETRVITGGAAAGTRIIWYSHPDNVGGLGFEREENSNPAAVNNRHFLTAGGKAIGVLVTTGSLATLGTGQTAPPALGSATAVKLEYWHKDHLGSLAATTDHLGTVTARYAYDPFGKRRYSTGVYDADGSVAVDWDPAHNAGTGRGFTGHEELDDIGLVNMNGRVFDPTLGMFVQADPHISDPENLQNYNRYAYVLNNPLNATDPSGFDDVPANDSGANSTSTQHIEITGTKLSAERNADTGTQTFNNLWRAGRAVDQLQQRYKIDKLRSPSTQAEKQALVNLWTNYLTELREILDFYELEPGKRAEILVQPQWALAVARGVAGSGSALEVLAAGIQLGVATGPAGVGPESIPLPVAPPQTITIIGTKIADPAATTLVAANETRIVLRSVNPKSLIGRQGPAEMTGSRVERFKKAMKANGYGSFPPIEAANAEGRLIILDGHHRAAAAARAGLPEVPVNVRNVTSQEASQLMREAAEAMSRRY